MPTENRSSNTEQMVSVPRDEVERLVKLLQYQAHPCPSPHAEFWQGLLDAPVAQHQGDPIVVEAVAVTRADDDEGLRLEWLLEGGIAALEFPGQVLLVAHGKVTDDNGSGELYLHPPTSDGFSAGDMADQGAKAFRDGQQVLTELNDDLREILGRPNFTCHHIANALRQMGRTIAKKSEEEQATVIHWMLGHYLQHGPDWRQHASDELKAASQASE